jgi:hypothetical protein
MNAINGHGMNKKTVEINFYVTKARKEVGGTCCRAEPEGATTFLTNPLITSTVQPQQCELVRHWCAPTVDSFGLLDFKLKNLIV